MKGNELVSEIQVIYSSCSQHYYVFQEEVKKDVIFCSSLSSNCRRCSAIQYDSIQSELMLNKCHGCNSQYLIFGSYVFDSEEVDIGA